MKLLSEFKLGGLNADSLKIYIKNYENITQKTINHLDTLKIEIGKKSNSILENLQHTEFEKSRNRYALDNSSAKHGTLKAKSESWGETFISKGAYSDFGMSSCETNLKGSMLIAEKGKTTGLRTNTGSRKRNLAADLCTSLEYNWGLDQELNLVTYISLKDDLGHIYRSVLVQGNTYFDILESLETNWLEAQFVNTDTLYELEITSNFEKDMKLALKEALLREQGVAIKQATAKLKLARRNLAQDEEHLETYVEAVSKAHKIKLTSNTSALDKLDECILKESESVFTQGVCAIICAGFLLVLISTFFPLVLNKYSLFAITIALAILTICYIIAKGVEEANRADLLKELRIRRDSFMRTKNAFITAQSELDKLKGRKLNKYEKTN